MSRAIWLLEEGTKLEGEAQRIEGKMDANLSTTGEWDSPKSPIAFAASGKNKDRTREEMRVECAKARQRAIPSTGFAMKLKIDRFQNFDYCLENTRIEWGETEKTS